MDNKRNTNGPSEGRVTEQCIDDVLFIPFYNGILTGDISKTGFTQDEFSFLSSEFFKISGKEKTSLEEQLYQIKIDVSILSGAMLTLIDGYDEEIAEVIRSFGIKISEDTLAESLEVVAIKVNRLQKDYKILESNKPPTPKSIEEMTAHDVVANLASNLEFGINFKEFTVGEYLSYTKVVKRKSDSIKKMKDGRRKH